MIHAFIGRVSSLPRTGQPQGFALVLVLAMLVLVAGLVTAYFSNALQERRTGSSSSANSEASLLAESATEMVLGDFLGEMEAGSHPDPMAGEEGLRILRPLMVTPMDGENISLAPSMFPQRPPVDDDPEADPNIPAILKISRSGVPFFDQTEGYTMSGPARASAVGTETASLQGRNIARQSWFGPRLLTETEFADFESPDWIYVDRAGNNPAVFDTGTLETLRSPAPDNDQYVIGRYAYVAYDVGGLVDINVVGNALDVSPADPLSWDRLAGRRGRLHQVNLENGLGEVELPDFGSFVEDWRSPTLSGDEDRLFDPVNAFLEIETGDQGFVNRRDLIAYIEEGGTGLATGVLPYLTVFNRDLNAPHWQPEPEREMQDFDDPGDSELAEVLNPSLLETRFTGETTLARGADPEVTVPAGTPLMPRRFPLGKLALFEPDEHEATRNLSPSQIEDSLEYYFGLSKVSGTVATYEYTETVDGRIARPHEIAALGREPNFFEILQAVIYTHSLGKSGGDARGRDDARDSLRNLQLLQIGANIIDQWDADDIPTTLRFPSGDSEDPWLEVYGVENLPYINQFATIPWRPGWDPDLFQVWAVFDVWNPHQNALNTPSGIERFKIVPTGGWIIFTPARYHVATPLGTHGFSQRSVRGSPGDPSMEVDEINEDWEIDFSATPSADGQGYGNFAEPRIIRGEEAESENDLPGVLLANSDMREVMGSVMAPAISSAAIPLKAERPSSIQQDVNEFWLDWEPYQATHPDPEVNPFLGHNMLGERLYRPETEFSHTTIEEDEDGNPIEVDRPGVNTTYWSHTQGFEDDGTLGEHVIYGKFAAKAHNFGRTRAQESRPTTFELQALIGGEWKTIQRLENWWRWGHGVTDIIGRLSQSSELRNNHTHHSGPNPDLEGAFYPWAKDGATGLPTTMTKWDVRSQRFGFSEIRANTLGHSIRSGLGPASSGPALDNKNWLFFWADAVAGRPPREGALGFEFWPPTNIRAFPAGIVSNNPDLEAPNSYHTVRYADRDGVIRPGDGYFGWDPIPDNIDLHDSRLNLPTVPGRYDERPIILNRPFRSVGELGYVFRDEPWKTLNFFSRQSADLGLLDVFTLEESVDQKPVIAGKVNLNSARPEVLAALLEGSTKQLAGINPEVSPAVLSSEEAWLLAEGVTQESRFSPFVHKGDVVPRLMHRENAGAIFDSELIDYLRETVIKSHREAAVRTLAEIGTTRTWNVMIDLVAQTGRFTTASQDGGDFLVTGERRYWVHAAIDRITGEIIELRKEAVHD